MLESQMENLIAKYAADFFPRKSLTLTGRQGAFSGVGRFDLMFVDEHETNILMELKARPAKYEDASQLAKYHDALKDRGTNHILMWLVAPVIPQSVREFLDRIGIEYTEIHESEYRAVALRHGEMVDLPPESEGPVLDIPLVRESREALAPRTKSNNRAFRMRSRVTPKFRASMDRLRPFFPAAHQFLAYIEQHSYDGFWLSTSTNAHLYFEDSFLAFIRLGLDSIQFAPNFHGQIDGTTVDRHKLIFPDLFRQLAEDSEGRAQPWATFSSNGSVTVRKQAPPEFFTGLVDQIQKVCRSANAA